LDLFKLLARLNGEEYAFFLNQELPGLWNQFKDYLYQEPIDTLEQLDDKIHETIVTIRENVQQNLIRRDTTSIESNGGHFEHRI
jgi:predicted component of type VI protein secretion system